MDALHRVVGRLYQFNSALLLVCKYLIIIIVAVIAIILIAAVVFRYGLNSALSWAEESGKYLMVWLTFLGAPIALREFGHINIDVLVKIIPPRMQQFMHLLVNLIICFTMSIVLWKGLGFAEQGARQVASSFNLSMFWLYISVPVGSALTILVAIEHALRSFIGIFRPDQGLVVTATEADSVY
ncbi:MAG: TRAP transporter small permease [Burkholderiaceae bacterium]